MARPLKLTAASALTQRGSTWWFIKTVPAELREHLGVSRWRFTLDTTDRQVALSRAQQFLDEVREKLMETADPASSYYRELDKLRGVSTEDAEFIMDTLYPETNPEQAGAFYAARRIAQGVQPPKQLFTMLSVANDYLKTAPENNREPTMLAVKLFGPDVPIVDVDRRLAGDFVDARKADVSVSTVQRNLSYLQQVYRHAMRMGLVDFSSDTPFSKWNLRQTDKRRTERMPDDLYKFLCDDLGDHRWIMVVSRLSGMRPSEVASVTLEERSGHPVWIPQHSKTSSGRLRIVPVHSSLIPIASDILPHLTPTSQRKASDRLKNLKSRGVVTYGRYVNLYSCRVSAITDMSAADDDVRRVLVGHRDINTGYIAEFNIEKLVAAIELIKDPLAGAYV